VANLWSSAFVSPFNVNLSATMRKRGGEKFTEVKQKQANENSRPKGGG
jgi:hypothetical protein